VEHYCVLGTKTVYISDKLTIPFYLEDNLRVSKYILNPSCIRYLELLDRDRYETFELL